MLSRTAIWRPLIRRAVSGLLLAYGALGAAQPASAQTCGSDYVIQEGESLAQIAGRVYGNASQWTIIFYANQDRLGANASLLVPGLSIKIPCVGGTGQQNLPPVATTPAQSTPVTPPAFLVSSMVQKIEFLTGDGLAPFTGRSLPNGGMVTHLVSAALDLVKEGGKARFDYGISWVNDWSAHLNPLLATRAFDAGFPWTRPDCEQFVRLDDNAKYRCQKFFFSDPLFEVLTHLFVKKDSPIKTGQDEEVIGKSLCRPAGYETYELDQDSRNWVKDNKVVLIRPQTVDECFRLLDAGSVDAVAVPDLVGQAAASATGTAERVRVVEKPLAIRTLHVVVSKGHPHARTVLYYINGSLARLRENGDYEKILETHLERFWEPGAETPAATPAKSTSPTVITAPGADTPVNGQVSSEISGSREKASASTSPASGSVETGKGEQKTK